MRAAQPTSRRHMRRAFRVPRVAALRMRRPLIRSRRHVVRHVGAPAGRAGERAMSRQRHGSVATHH